MRHPLTGERLVDEVLRSSQIYQGPFTDQGPDLQLISRGLKYHNVGFLQFQSKRWIGSPWGGLSGHHTLDGILAMAGPNARPGARIDGARIVDIAPTVLALLGQPIPDWMDGKILSGGLSDEFLAQGPPTVTHEETVPSQAAETTGYTTADEAQIAKRLADLGYIE